MLNSENPFAAILERLESIESKLDNQPTPTEKPKKTSGYISRNRVCELLDISLPTVHKLINEGKIPTYHLGGRTLFKEKEVLAAAKPVNYSVK